MRSRPRTVSRRRGLRAAAAGAAALVVTACAALVGLTAAALPAAAHDYIVSTSPTTGATVTDAVPQVKITYDDVVLDPQGDGSTTVLEVTDSAGKHYETGCPTILGRDISVPTSLGAAGTYVVTWRIVSADGHPVSGTWSFRYQPTSAATAAAGTAASVCGAAGGAAGGSDATAGTSGPVVSGSSGVGGGVIAGVVGVVALAVAAVVVLGVIRRRTLGADSRTPEAGDAPAGSKTAQGDQDEPGV